MLRLPEEKQPPCRETEGADEGRAERRGPHAATEQGERARLLLHGGAGPLPGVGFGDVAADPEHEKCRQHADEKHPALRAGRHVAYQQAHEDRAAEHPDVHAGLEHRGHPRAPGFRPRLGQQRRADRPLTTDAERGHETEDHELPPGLRQRAQAGADRIREHRQRKRAAAPEHVPQSPEKCATQRPADEKRRLDVGALFLDGRIRRVGRMQELHHEWRGNQRVEMQFEAVEQPAKPRGDAGLPLPGGDFAEVFGLGRGGLGGCDRSGVTHGGPLATREWGVLKLNGGIGSGRSHRFRRHHFNRVQARWRGQLTRWSLTMPVACMKA